MCAIAAAVSTDNDGNGLCVCHAVLQQLLEESERCSQMRCSGSGFDAGRSGITSTDSDGS